jgi:hypothetical protein
MSVTDSYIASIPVPTPLVDYDAYVPASYPGTGTTWASVGTLSKNLTIFGSPTWNAGGWFVMGGSSIHMDSGNNGAGLPSGSAVRSWAVMAWCDSASGYQCTMSQGANSGGERLDFATWDPSGRPAINGSGVSRYTPTALTGQWVYMQGRLASGSNLSNFEVWINGASVAMAGSTGGVNTSTADFRFGQTANNSNQDSFGAGKLMRGAIWDVSLSDAEIAADWAAVRSRVGL